MEATSCLCQVEVAAVGLLGYPWLKESSCEAEEGGRCCRVCGLLLFPKTLLVLGSRVRSCSSSCSKHNSRQCLLAGTPWPQLPLESARRNVKYPPKAGMEQRSRNSLCFGVLLLPASNPTQPAQKTEDVESQIDPLLPSTPLTHVPKCHIPPDF